MQESYTALGSSRQCTCNFRVKRSRWSQEGHTFLLGRLLPPLPFPHDAPTLWRNKKGSSGCKELQVTCHSCLQDLINVTDAADTTDTSMQIKLFEQNVSFTSFTLVCGVRGKEILKNHSCDHTSVLSSEVCQYFPGSKTFSSGTITALLTFLSSLLTPQMKV